jgi:predicted RecA/RadA family phage recombinase
MAGENTYLESDGKAVNVALTYTVAKGQLVVVENWLGIASDDGSSGDTIALSIDEREYQVTVPSGLAVAKGDKIYIEVADLTGHIPDDTAYSTTAGAGKVAFFKATAAKDSNHVVTGKMLPQ